MNCLKWNNEYFKTDVILLISVESAAQGLCGHIYRCDKLYEQAEFWTRCNFRKWTEEKANCNNQLVP